MNCFWGGSEGRSWGYQEDWNDSGGDGKHTGKLEKRKHQREEASSYFEQVGSESQGWDIKN